MERYLRGKH